MKTDPEIKIVKLVELPPIPHSCKLPPVTKYGTGTRIRCGECNKLHELSNWDQNDYGDWYGWASILDKCDRPPKGWFCNLEYEHEGPCPTYAKWWKKLEMRVRTGLWWP